MLYRRWADLVLLGLAGLAVAGLWSTVSPRRYGASAVVLVGDPESHDLYLINEQTALLEGIAYSDEVWEVVASDLARGGWISGPGDVESILRHISLPHPMRGEWIFYAQDRDPARAAEIANAWSRSFVASVTRAIEADRLRALNRERRLSLDGQLAAQIRRCSLLASAEEQARRVELSLAGQPLDAPGDPSRTAVLWSLAFWLADARASLPPLEDGASAVQQREYAASLGSLLEVEKTACQDGAEEVGILREAAFESEAAYADGLRGLLPGLTVSLMRESQPPDRPTVPLAGYLLVGAIVGMGAGLLQMLLSAGKRMH